MTSTLRRTVVIGITVLTLVAVTGGSASAGGRSAALPLQTHV